MPDVLVACPQERDLHLAPRVAAAGGYGVLFAGPDLDASPAEPAALVDELSAIRLDAVVGTKDRSALVAALVAERLGLPGPAPAAVVRCQHKPTSRQIQQRLAPEATPPFALLEGPPPFPPPWFVKPTVGRLSQEARRVDDQDELARVAEQPGYRESYGRLAALAGLSPQDAHGFVVEELVTGDEVTLEGYVHRGDVTVIGVTDSIKYPGTNSFERFEYPSALGPERLAELDDLARRLVGGHGLDACFFNVEFLVPAAGPAKIVEVNARIASQFAPLVEAVHGRSTYDALFALSCGEDPAWVGGSPRGVAISYVIRVFEDGLVEEVPEPEEGLELLVRPGTLLSEQGTNDTASYRLAIFTQWGETREEAVKGSLARARRLRFRVGPDRAGRRR
jgi:hypothetical protein